MPMQMHSGCVADSQCLTLDTPGGRIRHFRKARELTQQALADLLFVDQTTVARWELGRVTVPRPMRRRLAEALDIPRAVLFGEDAA
jgi:transcriptional regulator with XRE-family HTH domain